MEREPGDYGTYGPHEYIAHHPNYYVFEGQRFAYVDPKDEPELWREYQDERSEAMPVYYGRRFKRFYQHKRTDRPQVLRGFNRYVKDVYEN